MAFAYTFRYRPDPALDADTEARILAIPGVRRGYGRDAGSYTAPLNGAWIVERTLADLGLTFRAEAPVLPAPLTWPDVRAQLEAQGEVQPWVYDFATPYQQEDVAWCATRPGAHLWWVAGSGKTLGMILWLLLFPGPCVVVTKAATRGQWAAEVRRFSSVRPYVVVPAAQRRRGYPDLADYVAGERAAGRRPFVVLGWEALPATVAELQSTLGIGYHVGFDESHKGKGTKRRKATLQPDGSYTYADLDNVVTAASRLAKGAARRMASTATPVKDRVRDLWGQLDLVEPGAYGSFSVFARRYCDAKPGAFGGVDTTGSSRMDELVGRLGFVARKRSFRETHRNLPPKRRQSWYIPHADQNRGWSATKLNAELKRAAARGPSALLEVRLAASAAAKRDAIVDAVADALAAGQKVVVFDGRTENVDAMYTALAKVTARMDAAPKVWAAYGAGSGPHKTTPETREIIRADYMAHPGPCVLVGTGDAWGTGYNLHDTDLAIFAMLPWTGGDLHQWEGRFSRQGQKRPVLILFPICEQSADTHVANILIEKLPAMERIADDTETAAAHAALAGTDDKEAIATSILDLISSIDFSHTDD
jgi:hypothetical protein